MKKNICILRSNPVNPDSRVEKESVSLYNNGYGVIILCWDRDSDHDVTESKYKDTDITIYRIGVKASFGEGFKNIKQYLRFQFLMRKWLKKNKDKFDVIHACDFDTAFFSRKIAKKLKKKFVFDIFDFICGDADSFFKKRVKKAQYKLINKADATIICSEDRLKQIDGTKPKYLEIIHNSPNKIDVSKYNESSDNKYTVTVVYVGILSNNRLLLEEAEVFKKHSDWHFVVGGFGLHEEFFKELAINYSNIEYLGRIQYDQTLLEEQKADIILAVYDPALENHRFAAPNKFYEGLMLGKPLIMVKNTGMSQIVKDNNIGELIDYTAESFENAITNLINRKAEWNEISVKMNKLYSDSFSWEIMEKRLIKLYDNLFKSEVE